MLHKAKNQHGGICHCHCKSSEAVASQRSCPWCGCGWLWICAECRKGFTVAEDEEGLEYTLLNRAPVPLTPEALQLSEGGRRTLSTVQYWRG